VVHLPPSNFLESPPKDVEMAEAFVMVVRKSSVLHLEAVSDWDFPGAEKVQQQCQIVWAVVLEPYLRFLMVLSVLTHRLAGEAGLSRSPSYGLEKAL